MKANAIDKSYLEFDLDAETLDAVETLASESRLTPFEMCIVLLEEQIASYPGQSPHE